MKTVITVDKQKDFYDKRWREMQFAGPHKLARSIAILEAIASAKLIEPKIVDLGCGAGWLAAIVAQFGPTVAIDFSEAAIAVATEKYNHVQFIAANIFDWDYPKGAFDIVISQEIIEHIDNIKDQERYLEIASDLLHDDGLLILTTPSAAIFNALQETLLTTYLDQPVENLLSKQELKSLLRKRFKIISMTTIIPTHGTKGRYKIINSYFLKSFFDKLCLGRIFDKIRLRLGYGLHAVAIAKKI
jgi:2-polyprenyl-3-methyl-5-hydroxy-6-metoxy-1,4-benzoquinol methylase